MTTVIVDYGAGNIGSVANALAEIGEPASVISDASGLASASRIIMPGVGAMAPAMAALHARGLVTGLKDAVAGRKLPFLGICLGMQIMCDVGYENETTAGLGLVEGEVKPLHATPPQWRVPHMGWAEVDDRHSNPLFQDIRESAAFYFCHSYYVSTSGAYAAGMLRFGDISAVVALQSGNAFGVQFHPERSGSNGLKLLENFITWSDSADAR